MTEVTLADLTDRAREIFCTLVDTYLETGDPVGSRTLSRRLTSTLSPATVRNAMQDLEEMGLLAAPHPSAGRLPSEVGLRLFVDALLEVGDAPTEDASEIVAALSTEGGSAERILSEAGQMLSGMSMAAALVLVPTEDKAIDHVEFVQLGDGSTLVALVMQDGTVENRLFETPSGLTPSAVQEAANYLNAHARGRSLSETRAEVARRTELGQQEIDESAQRLVAAGVASWDGAEEGPDRLIVRGLSNLIDGNLGAEELARLRRLLDDLERQKTVVQLLDLARDADGVRVFIGSENPLFSLSGSSLVISPYMNSQQKVVGALGVIGPTRLNYGRVVPAVDFTARLVGRILEGNTEPVHNTEDQ